MENNKLAVTALACAVVFLSAGLLFFHQMVVNVAPPSVTNQLGASPGTDHYNQEWFRNSIGFGSDKATYTVTSTPVSAADICNGKFISVAVANGGATGNLSLPSSSAVFANCLVKAGDNIKVSFQNNSSTGSFTLIAIDSSSTILGTLLTSTAAVSPASISAGGIAEVRALRVTSGTQAWLDWVITSFR